MSDVIRERGAVLKNFSGGLNNWWDPSTIAENEVPYLENMEFSPTGALTSRPPIWDPGIAFPEANTHFNLLGYYITESGSRYAIFTSPTKTYVYDIDGTTAWTQIWNHPAADFAQYQSYIIMCRVNGSGAYWKPGGAPTYNSVSGLWDGTNTSWAEIATMPAGRGIELHQERLFLFGPLNSDAQSVLYWSNITGEDLGAPGKDWRWWEPLTSLTSVNGGDGQWITGLVTGYNEITIFRNASTFRFTFAELPTEGTISKVQGTIGAENQYCIAVYESTIFVLSRDQVYTYYNGTFQSLNDQKVRFEEKENSENYKIRYAISALGSRLVVWFGGNMYVAQLKTGTWSFWTTNTEVAYVKTFPSLSNDIGEAKEAFGVSASATSSKWKVWKMKDHFHDSAGPEAMTCRLKTRIYDFDTPHEWKRLFWWAADVIASSQVIARVYPVSVFTSSPDWDRMSSTTWDLLTGNWENPPAQEINIETVVATGYDYLQRLSLKLDRGIRFRRVYFELEMASDGTAGTAPVQIFSIMPMISAKAGTLEKVS